MGQTILEGWYWRYDY